MDNYLIVLADITAYFWKVRGMRKGVCSSMSEFLQSEDHGSTRTLKAWKALDQDAQGRLHSQFKYLFNLWIQRKH